MKTITFAGYLATNIAYILNVCRFVSRSTFQMPKLGYSSYIIIKKFVLKTKRQENVFLSPFLPKTVDVLFETGVTTGSTFSNLGSMLCCRNMGMLFFGSSSLITSLFALKESLRLSMVGEPIAFSAKFPSVTDTDRLS